MKLALIGNCAYQALIDDRARVRWLCWPRFDSSFVFGNLLDEEKGGIFSVEPAAPPSQIQQEYLANTNILRTVFRTGEDLFEVLDFAPRFAQYERFYKPTMLIRRIRPLAGGPVVRVRCRPVYDYGRLQLEPTMASNHIYWKPPGSELRLTTNVPLTFVLEERPFLLEADAYLVLTWGRPLEAPLEETCDKFLRRTRRYWETWVRHGVVPDRFQRPVIRSALALKLHQYEDTGAITAATTTSLPEYPGSGRNWDYRFCWLRDACFTLGALRRIGQFEEMERFVTYLLNIAEQSPERLQPVYGISGESRLDERILDHLAGYEGNRPVRIGNDAYRQLQNDVYGEMIAALAPLFLDVRFQDLASTHSTSLLERLLARIEQTMEVPDSGPWEKRGPSRIHTFSLLMHWTGACAAARIGERCGNRRLAEWGRRLGARARDLIEKRCWRPDRGHYADSVETDDADAALLMMVNLGYLDPSHPHAETHVRALGERLRADHHLLYRYLQDDGLGETKASFTVCGFWYAEALARLGRVDEAEEVFRKLCGHANHVGLLSEDIDPETGRLWGNFPQAYSHVGLINAAFAISPVAGPIV
ncbi:MAG: glycoside hydrolase family 15 protein [Acidobacteria bacterium]|nr:MAG: glycoside hydrolase family 15 protein [Acidobacteriota bacterium]